MSKEITNKFRRRQRALFLKRALLIMVLFGALLGGVLFVMDRALRVKKIEVAGNEKIPSEEITEYAAAVFNTGLFSSLLKKDITPFSSEALEKKLEEKFSAIDGVAVSRNLLKRSALIQIQERIPWAIWCLSARTDISVQTRQEECFYVDEKGIAFGASPEFSGELFLKIKDGRRFAQEGEKTILEEGVLKMLRDFLTNAEKNKGLEIKNIEIKEGPELILYSEGLRLIVDTETDFGRAGENLDIFLNSVSEKDLKKIDYIDLRFTDRAFYKTR